MSRGATHHLRFLRARRTLSRSFLRFRVYVHGYARFPLSLSLSLAARALFPLRVPIVWHCLVVQSFKKKGKLIVMFSLFSPLPSGFLHSASASSCRTLQRHGMALLAANLLARLSTSGSFPPEKFDNDARNSTHVCTQIKS